MHVRDYSTAILELLKEGRDEKTLLQGLTRVLKERGHERLYAKILTDLAQRLAKDTALSGGTITLARASDEAKLKEEITDALTKLGVATYTTKIDPTITGGYIAEGGQKRIDASYKKSLLTLYRSLIS